MYTIFPTWKEETKWNSECILVICILNFSCPSVRTNLKAFGSMNVNNLVRLVIAGIEARIIARCSSTELGREYELANKLQPREANNKIKI